MHVFILFAFDSVSESRWPQNQALSATTHLLFISTPSFPFTFLLLSYLRMQMKTSCFIPPVEVLFHFTGVSFQLPPPPFCLLTNKGTQRDDFPLASFARVDILEEKKTNSFVTACFPPNDWDLLAVFFLVCVCTSNGGRDANIDSKEDWFQSRCTHLESGFADQICPE